MSITTRTVTEPVQCDVCGEKFKDNRGLSAHIRAKHDKSPDSTEGPSSDDILKRIEALERFMEIYVDDFMTEQRKRELVRAIRGD
jgi:hypothetical protein